MSTVNAREVKVYAAETGTSFANQQLATPFIFVARLRTRKVLSVSSARMSNFQQISSDLVSCAANWSFGEAVVR